MSGLVNWEYFLRLAIIGNGLLLGILVYLMVYKGSNTRIENYNRFWSLVSGQKVEDLGIGWHIYIISSFWAFSIFLLIGVFFLTDLADYFYRVNAVIHLFVGVNCIFLVAASYHLGLNGDIRGVVFDVNPKRHLRFLLDNLTFRLNEAPRWLAILSGSLFWAFILVAVSLPFVLMFWRG